MKATDFCTVITTTDNEENAELITRTLLEEQLAACVQKMRIQSAYRWKGQVISADEFRLDIKTKKTLLEALKKRIARLHTYDVPEILIYTMDDANEEYLRWLDEETQRTSLEEHPDADLWHNG